MGSLILANCLALVLHLNAVVGLAPDPQAQEGTVVSAGVGKLVMLDTGGKQQSFSVIATTKITVHGKPGKLEDLQPSHRIRVTTDAEGKLLIVSTIDRKEFPANTPLSRRFNEESPQIVSRLRECLGLMLQPSAAM